MSYGPDDWYRSPGGAISVKNIRSKIIELQDHIADCENDERALNGWRELCAYGLALVMDVEAQKKLPSNDGGTDWNALVRRLKEDWDKLKTSEKTLIEIGREGNFEYYMVQWDSYVGTFARGDLPQGVAIMDKEKYNAICHRLMQFWGLCEAVLFASGVFVIDDKIEIPEKPANVYTDDHMREDISSRRMPKRQNARTSPN